MMLYIDVKICENISNDIRVMERTQNYDALMHGQMGGQTQNILEGIT